jgi:hypothetical protein
MSPFMMLLLTPGMIPLHTLRMIPTHITILVVIRVMVPTPEVTAVITVVDMAVVCNCLTWCSWKQHRR